MTQQKIRQLFRIFLTLNFGGAGGGVSGYFGKLGSGLTTEIRSRRPQNLSFSLLQIPTPFPN